MGKEQGILATLDGRTSRDGRMVRTVFNLDTGGCNGESKECTNDKGLESRMEITFGARSSSNFDGRRFSLEDISAQCL